MFFIVNHAANRSVATKTLTIIRSLSFSAFWALIKGLMQVCHVASLGSVWPQGLSPETETWWGRKARSIRTALFPVGGSRQKTNPHSLPAVEG